MESSHSEELECKRCNKTFSQKSSLVRHLKLCARPKSVSVRQKSCHQCSLAKARCDLERPSCSRCISRSSTCQYPSQPQGHGTPQNGETRKAPVQPDNTAAYQFYQNAQPLSDMAQGVHEPPILDFQDGDMHPCDAVCGTDFETSSCGADTLMAGSTAVNTPEFGGCGNEWMLSLLPQSNPLDSTPLLVKHSMRVLLRLFRTWPRMVVKEFQLPPIFHHTAVPLEKPLPQLLSNCFTLAKMWDGQVEGSSAMVQETVLKEMRTIFSNLQTYDEPNLLAALQALTIYTIILIFPSKNQNAVPSVDPSVFVGLQQVVYYTAGTGLILQEENDHAVPSWEAWIHVTSKRRVIFALYMLHWAYSVYHGLSSFDCHELGFMPAPAAKFLWQANTKKQWEAFYKRWLIQWNGREYLQKEFEDIKPGVILDRRTQMWLEDADELGILFLSIWNTTDREPEFMAHKLKSNAESR